MITTTTFHGDIDAGINNDIRLVRSPDVGKEPNRAAVVVRGERLVEVKVYSRFGTLEYAPVTAVEARLVFACCYVISKFLALVVVSEKF